MIARSMQVNGLSYCSHYWRGVGVAARPEASIPVPVRLLYRYVLFTTCLAYCTVCTGTVPVERSILFIA
jgi:hypothetical protein